MLNDAQIDALGQALAATLGSDDDGARVDEYLVRLDTTEESLRVWASAARQLGGVARKWLPDLFTADLLEHALLEATYALSQPTAE